MILGLQNANGVPLYIRIEHNEVLDHIQRPQRLDYGSNTLTEKNPQAAQPEEAPIMGAT
jgi:hypothetical protein